MTSTSDKAKAETPALPVELPRDLVARIAEQLDLWSGGSCVDVSIPRADSEAIRRALAVQSNPRPEQFQAGPPYPPTSVPALDKVLNSPIASAGDTARTVSHEQAAESARRLINSYFGNDGGAHASIPADPSRDDDLLITAYIVQQRAFSERAEAALADARKATIEQCAKAAHGFRHQGGIQPSDKYTHGYDQAASDIWKAIRDLSRSLPPLQSENGNKGQAG